MINYKIRQLANGLTIIAHRDSSTPIAALNLIYKVGARNESPEHTGFAHLFEHLMFSGSRNVKSFDGELQLACGDNNAFTTNDYTNYYITLPKDNLETALWLESDRMLYPSITQQNLDVQRSVVVEEFNQRNLNEPYGDVWMLLRPLAYKKHPYAWATIGKTVDHIKNATLNDVKTFFDAYYTPSNAILSVVADMDEDQILDLSEKWFVEIPYRAAKIAAIPQEPEQTEARKLEVTRDVPATCIYRVYKMCDRFNPDFYVCDLLTDILASGRSSRFYERLINNSNLFSSIDSYISSHLDPGFLCVAASLLPGVGIDEAEAAIDFELNKICTQAVSEHELAKVKNKAESAQVYAEIGASNKASQLGYCQMLGDIDLVNTEFKRYAGITADDILRVAANVFNPARCSTLYYKSQKQNK